MAESETRAAPEEEASPLTLVAPLVGWLVPGAGHWLLGRRARGVIFLLLVLASVVVGWSLEGKLYRMESDQPLTVLATLASMGSGLAYFLLRFFWDYTGEVTAPGFEYGSAFLLTAGLMNLLVLLDCWDIARGHKE